MWQPQRLQTHATHAMFAGEHTRSITLATPSLAAGGIMRFAKVRLACLGCRAPLPPGHTDLCEHCRPKVC